MSHRVMTTHIQRLIANALTIAEEVDGASAGNLIVLSTGVYDADLRPDLGEDEKYGAAGVEDALEKAVADLRHAADELDAERLSCKGWRQV